MEDKKMGDDKKMAWKKLLSIFGVFFLIMAGSLSDTINSVVYYCYEKLFFLAEFAFRLGGQVFP